MPTPPKKNLLIFGINYAPEVTGIAPYTTDLAEHMTCAGWCVTVVTGLPHYPEWKVSPPYRRMLRHWEGIHGVTVRRLRHYVPTRHSALGRALYEATFAAHALTPGRMPRANLVVCVVPSLGSAAAAALAARRHGSPLVLIFQDLVGHAAVQSGIPKGALASGPASALERWVSRRANGISVVAENFRPHLEALGVKPERIVHIPNWTHVESPTGDRQAVRRSLGWPTGLTIILHAGNMGYKQDLGNVVEAARLAERDKVPFRFVLMGHGTERRRLEAQASGLANVYFLDPQPKNAFVDILNAADILLVNERSSVTDMSLPSKITSYFIAGRPVVAAVAAGGTTEGELMRSGGALITEAGKPVALLATLRHAVSDAAHCADLVARGRAYVAANLDRSVQLARVEQFITSKAKG